MRILVFLLSFVSTLLVATIFIPYIRRMRLVYEEGRTVEEGGLPSSIAGGGIIMLIPVIFASMVSFGLLGTEHYFQLIYFTIALISGFYEDYLESRGAKTVNLKMLMILNGILAVAICIVSGENINREIFGFDIGNGVYVVIPLFAVFITIVTYYIRDFSVINTISLMTFSGIGMIKGVYSDFLSAVAGSGTGLFYYTCPREKINGGYSQQSALVCIAVLFVIKADCYLLALILLLPCMAEMLFVLLKKKTLTARLYEGNQFERRAKYYIFLYTAYEIMACILCGR